MLEITETKVALGIDFGTTFCVASIIEHERCLMVPLEPSSEQPYLMPSSIGIDEHGKWFTGLAAQQATYHVNSIKRFLAHLVPNSANEIYGYQLRLGANGLELQLDDWYLVVDLASYLFAQIKLRAEDFWQGSLEDVVITVPAYFDEPARHLIKLAATVAGFNVLRLLNEPTAAALAYGLNQNAAQANLEGLVLVFDLGGGTFDLSLLQLSEGVFHVLATSGDNFLGGDDIDRLIQQAWCPQESLSVARFIKESMSRNQEYIYKANHHEYTLQDLAVLIQPLLDKIETLINNLLEAKNILLNAIEHVVAVGGSTKLPLIVAHLAKITGQQPLVSINPDEAVARGAAWHAEALMHKKQEHLLLNVIPISFGIEIMGEMVDKIIFKNSSLPVIKSVTYTTQVDNQTSLLIHVLQGESEHLRECRSLAKFVLKNIPPQARGLPRIHVSFTVDVNGLLLVSAKVESKPTGLASDAADRNNTANGELVGNNTQIEVNRAVEVYHEVLIQPLYGLDEQYMLNLIAENKN